MKTLKQLQTEISNDLLNRYRSASLKSSKRLNSHIIKLGKSRNKMHDETEALLKKRQTKPVKLQLKNKKDSIIRNQKNTQKSYKKWENRTTGQQKAVHKMAYNAVKDELKDLL